MQKKKILIQTDFSLSKTGFARSIRAILTHLYELDKYELVHYCCGLNYSNPVLQKTPWKSIGCLPDSQQEIEAINKDPNLARNAGYGAYLLDKVIEQEKPDIYIAIQDFWGVDFAIDKKWWNKIPCAIWTTLDSLPLLPSAVEKAPKIENYWIWSSFATKEFHRLGHKHVKTLHGALDTKYFHRLPQYKRNQLKQDAGLDLDTFIVGFVFRNQLRKSAPNLLEGFSLFKKENIGVKAKLLLHTSYKEGWNINRLADQYGVDKADILTTYICQACNRYEIKSHCGEEIPCKFCGQQKSMITTGVGKGVTETQLNEVYNLMEVYCHPFTSGGQEIPVQEAKLTELVTLVTNYSCGEEICEDGAGSLPLEWSQYTEHGTEFIKASTYPSSICKQLTKVYKMPVSKRLEMGRQARQWTINGYSSEVICKRLMEFIDGAPETKYDFKPEEDLKKPNAQIPSIENEKEWLKYMYKNILNMDVSDQDSGLGFWQGELDKVN